MQRFFNLAAAGAPAPDKPAPTEPRQRPSRIRLFFLAAAGSRAGEAGVRGYPLWAIGSTPLRFPNRRPASPRCILSLYGGH